MDDHPWMTIHGGFFDNFQMCSHVFRVIVSDLKTFQVDPEGFQMIPECPRAFSERFGAVKVLKSQANVQKTIVDCFFGRKIIWWESFETVVAEVSDRLELIVGVNGRSKFGVRSRTYVLRAKRGPSEAR